MNKRCFLLSCTALAVGAVCNRMPLEPLVRDYRRIYQLLPNTSDNIVYIDNLEADGPGSAKAAFEGTNKRYVMPLVKGMVHIPVKLA